MKIAVLSDIHGNHIALAAVLEQAKKKEVEKLFLLGDYVGYFYHPDKVLALLEKWDKEMIKGNHETFLSEKSSQHIITNYGHGIEVAKKILNKNQLDMLLDLPTSKKVIIDEVSFILYHGSPGNPEEYIYPDANAQLLQKYSMGADFILLGHTHHSFTFSYNNTVLINPGSVGQPRDQPLASWVIIDTANRTVIQCHTYFNPQEIITDVKKYDPTKESFVKRWL